MRILQINSGDRPIGAQRTSLDLHKTYLAKGFDSRLMVNFKTFGGKNITEIDAYKNTSFWSPICKVLDLYLAHYPTFRGQQKLRDLLRQVAWLKRWLDRAKGIEDFNYPYSYCLFDEPKWRPDIIHCHNLHTNYFDLKALEFLSKRVPIVLTLHDEWFLTGHCAYSIDCQRWLQGCGSCPDLTRYPAIKNDKADYNWQRKKSIYAKSDLFIVTPSRWLMNRVYKSILKPECKQVINNGVDLFIFKPGDKKKIKEKLNLPEGMFIMLFVSASGSKKDFYKNYSTIESCVNALDSMSRNILFICIGGDKNGKIVYSNRIFTGFISDTETLVKYYQAADVFIHAASADNFPYTILEAQACGLPVIATAVGGIPEQIENGVTGFLLPRGDSAMMAEKVLQLVDNAELKANMAKKARERAEQLYDLDRMVSDYLNIYSGLTNDAK